MNANVPLQQSFAPDRVEVISVEMSDHHITYFVKLNTMGPHAFPCLLHRKSSINHNPLFIDAQHAAVPRGATTQDEEIHITHQSSPRPCADFVFDDRVPLYLDELIL